MTGQVDGSADTHGIGSFQRQLSEWNARFMQLAMSDQGLRGQADAGLSFEGLRSHSWPTFVDTGRIQEWARMSLAMRDVILRAGLALIPNKADAIADLFRYPREHATLVTRLLAIRERREAFAAKADFLICGAGLKCCEFDFGDIGLWHLDTFNTMFRHSSITKELVMRGGIRVRERHPLRTAIGELVKAVGRRGPFVACNCSIIVPDDTPAEDFELGRQQAAYARLLYQAALQSLGIDGDLVLERSSRLGVHDGNGAIDGKPIHVVMTQAPSLSAEAGIWMQSPLLDLVERQRVIAVNGPDCATIGNKIVLALLSEAADAGRLDADDAALIRSALPWTRRVARSKVERGGREHWLPELLVSCKDDFVLKPGEGFSSDGVRIGLNTSSSDWKAAVAIALEAGTWVAQEAVGGTPMWFPGEDGSPAAYGANIGIVSCGSEYAGVFLRLMPVSDPDHISAIGYAGGALTGGVIEVDG